MTDKIGSEMLARFLAGDTSMLKCTVCGSQAGTCDCWSKCWCGWSFRKPRRAGTLRTKLKGPTNERP